MEIKQLKSFIAVVDYGNFTKAAEKTYTSQPTISTHIKALEEELGVNLISRDTKNIEVTQKGKELYDCAINILELEGRLIRRWSDENNKIIHLGVSTIPSTYILPEILKGYSKLYPDVHFVITQGDSSTVAEGLESGIFDLGLLGMDCNGDKLKCDSFCEDEMVLITAPTAEYQLLHRQENPYPELFKHPVIFREQGSGSQKSAEMVVSALGVDIHDLNITARINDQETIKNLVEAGLGISIVSRLAVEERIREGRLLAFELPKEHSTRLFYIAVNKSAVKSDAVKGFMKYVKKTYYH